MIRSQLRRRIRQHPPGPVHREETGKRQQISRRMDEQPPLLIEEERERAVDEGLEIPTASPGPVEDEDLPDRTADVRQPFAGQEMFVESDERRRDEQGKPAEKREVIAHCRLRFAEGSVRET